MHPEQLAADGSEHGHQSAFFCWIALSYSWLYYLIFAVPNGGARGDSEKSNKIRGGWLKAEGVKASIPDIFCAVPRGKYAGLFIEMKRPAFKDKPAGRCTPDQLDCHHALRAQNYAVVVTFGWNEAARQLKSYLETGTILQ